MIRGIRAWFQNVVHRSAADSSLDEELRACVEILAAQKIQAGARPEEARRQALLEIGGVEGVKERVRDARRGSRLEAIVRDLRHTTRVLRRQPVLTTAVVLTLAIGIGSPAATFGLLHRFVFGAPVSPDPEAYFRMSRVGGFHVTTPETYLALRDRNTSTRQLAAWSSSTLQAPLGTEDPSAVVGSLVSCSVLGLFGVTTPVAGRLLTPDDCATDLPVAVLSERIWRSRFGADRSLVGSSMRYGGDQLVIVGVADVPSLRRNWDDADELVDVWIPYTAHAQLPNTATFGRHDGWLEVAGLLAPGVSRQAATAEFRSIDESMGPAGERRRPLVLTDGSRWAEAPGEMLGLLAAALALPALILVVACINVSALLLSRSVSRRREMAVRLALGTSRAALVRLLLTETLLLCVLASAVSLFLVYSVPTLLIRYFDAGTWLGAPDALAPDWRVFAFVGACGVVATVLSGLTPALMSVNPRPADSLAGRQETGTGRRTSRTRRVLVGVQIGASMAPLVAAVTLAAATSRFAAPDFRKDGILVASVPRHAGVPPASVADALDASPGVAAAAYAETIPLLRESAMRIQVPGHAGSVFAAAASVSPRYFELFDIPLLAGRAFASEDAAGAADPRPVVVSRQFARRFLNAEQALGTVVERDWPEPGQFVIVGIAADRLTGTAFTSAAPRDGTMIYELMPPSTEAGYVFVEAAGDSEGVAGALRARLRELTGSPIAVVTLDAMLADRVAGVRRVGTVLVALGGIGLLLAVVGMIGTVSFDASQRRREFAIRHALGAGPWTVRRHVVLSGMRPLPIGLGFGLLASWGALAVADSMGMLPIGSALSNPWPYAAIALLLIGAAVTALVAVAYPAGSRDPLPALREE
jgi:predicted permease